MTSGVSEDLKQRSTQARYANWIRVLQIYCSVILSVIGKCGIAVSVLAKIGFYDELKLLDHYENINVNVFLAYSVLLVAISWLGIFAGLRNNIVAMFVSATLQGLLITASIGYIVATSVLTNYTESGLLYSKMSKDISRNSDIANTLRSTLLCCGLRDNEWDMNPLPKSCCSGIKNKDDCFIGSIFLHNKGCFKEFLRMRRFYSWTLFTIVAGYSLLGIFGIILSHLRCQIMKDMKKKHDGGDLKIPRAHVMQNEKSHEEKKDQEKNKEEKSKKEENEKENKEIKEKEEIKNVAGSSKSEEAQTSEKKNSMEIITESNTCRNICKELTCGRVNINL